VTGGTESLTARTARLRNERATALMADRRIDNLLLGTTDQIRYVCDYRSLLTWESHDWVLAVVDRDGQADVYGAHVREVLHRPHPELAAVRSVRPLSGWVPAMTEPRTVVRAMTSALQSAARVGYDAVHPQLVDALRDALPGTEFCYVGDDLFQMRQIKMAEEVELLTLAYHDNIEALEAAWAVAAPGATDRDVLAASLAKQQQLGAEVITHYTCNVRAPAGVWFPIGTTIQPGDGIYLDQVYYGQGGYTSDLTRTVFVGEPPREVMHAYDTLLNITGEIVAQARPGVTVSALDRAFNDALAKNGLAGLPYGLGHGIGLRVCEPPSITDATLLDGDSVLREGHVVALEPETSIEVGGRAQALKVEDVYVMEANGLRPLGPVADARNVVLHA
jgi:Xaa-Pro dipeptidase